MAGVKVVDPFALGFNAIYIDIFLLLVSAAISQISTNSLTARIIKSLEDPSSFIHILTYFFIMPVLSFIVCF